MTSPWVYHPWQPKPWDKSDGLPLKADQVLEITSQGSSTQPDVEHWVIYADQAYLACRILMLSSRHIHYEALYCAQQTLEKYMKAILCKEQRLGRVGHDLNELAHLVGQAHQEFNDQEFLKVCQKLTQFEEAGRYPDSDVDIHEHDLSLLTFLDFFVTHCRDILSFNQGLWNTIAEYWNEPQNRTMQAVRQTLEDNNRYLGQLLP